MATSTCGGTATATETNTETRNMPMYRVLFHNDNVTQFGFVITVLVQIFNKSFEDAVKITEEVHKSGIGLAGVYALEHAEIGQEQTISLARAQKFPLQVTIELAD